MEVAAGLVAAEQVISTTIEGGVVASWAIQRPTLPLKASFSRIGTASDDSPGSLARSSHSLNIIDGDIYIFGGKVAGGQIASNEMHILKLSNVGTLGSQYQAVTAVSRDGEAVPCPRAGHTACVIDGKIVVYGGYDNAEKPQPIEESGRVWIFDPSSQHWNFVDAQSDTYPERHSHAAVAHGNRLIVHGGFSKSDSVPNTETWSFDLGTRTWLQLSTLKNPEGSTSMIATAPPNLALANDKIFVVTGSSDLGSQIHMLDLGEQIPDTHAEWKTIPFPTNPLTPGPRPRKGAALVSVDAGLGRKYLVFMLGEKDEPQSTDTGYKSSESNETSEFWSGLWALQLESTKNTPAQAKDLAREQIPHMKSHELEWAEIQLDVKDEPGDSAEGKAHPGPRAYFTAQGVNVANIPGTEGTRVIMWGGVNPAGEPEGDGWMVDLHT